jgi:PAS domain S-box-containing protein
LRRLFSKIVKNTPDTVTITDLNGRILCASEKAIGLSKAGTDKALINLQKTLEIGTAPPLEFKFLTLEGDSYFGELSAKVIKNKLKNPVAFIASIRDITKRKKAENLKQEKIRELKKLRKDLKNTLSEGNIKINTMKKRGYIQISIKDNGIGLKPNEMNLLFKKFGKIIRNEKGLEEIDISSADIGLFLIKKIVQQHGGIISATSDGRFKGAEFTIKLPS